MTHYQLFDCGMYMLRKIRWFDLHLKDDIELNFIKKIEKLQNHTHKSQIHTNCALLHILEKSKDVRIIYLKYKKNFKNTQIHINFHNCF